MKLRIHKNQLRLRLSKPDVARLVERGELEETLKLPNEPNLSFLLQSGGLHAASFDGKQIRIIAPAGEIKAWAETDRVGIAFEMGEVKVLIEKDFQCSHASADENNDAFPKRVTEH